MISGVVKSGPRNSTSCCVCQTLSASPAFGPLHHQVIHQYQISDLYGSESNRWGWGSETLRHQHINHNQGCSTSVPVPTSTSAVPDVVTSKKYPTRQGMVQQFIITRPIAQTSTREQLCFSPSQVPLLLCSQCWTPCSKTEGFAHFLLLFLRVSSHNKLHTTHHSANWW